MNTEDLRCPIPQVPFSQPPADAGQTCEGRPLVCFYKEQISGSAKVGGQESVRAESNYTIRSSLGLKIH